MHSGNVFTFPQLFACISECSRVIQWRTQLLVPGCSFIKLQEHGNYISGSIWNVGKEQNKKERILYETLKKKNLEMFYVDAF